MRAYYNEIDPYAARWLRNLIEARLITPGEVDERSILDVRPDDLVGFERCHFFAGIGVWDYALGLAGWPEGREVWTGSCPCQPFSAAGKRGGTSDERHLWPAFFHLIEQRGPATVLGEQVASKDGLDWLDLVHADLEGAGYDFGATDLCAAGVGAPHIRQRLWFVADADGRKPWEARRLQPGREHGQQQAHGVAGLVADASGSGRHARVADDASTRHELHDAGGGAAGILSDPSRDRFQGAQSTEPTHRGRRLADESREVGSVADAAGERRNGSQLAGAPGAAPARSPEADRGWSAGLRQPPGCSATLSIGHNGGPSLTFWSECDWIVCRDDKARPVEPGTFPLAHGATSRVGRLRAYGNAICAEAALAFIEAVMQVRP